MASVESPSDSLPGFARLAAIHYFSWFAIPIMLPWALIATHVYETRRADGLPDQIEVGDSSPSGATIRGMSWYVFGIRAHFFAKIYKDSQKQTVQRFLLLIGIPTFGVVMGHNLIKQTSAVRSSQISSQHGQLGSPTSPLRSWSPVLPVLRSLSSSCLSSVFHFHPDEPSRQRSVEMAKKRDELTRWRKPTGSPNRTTGESNAPDGFRHPRRCAGSI